MVLNMAKCIKNKKTEGKNMSKRKNWSLVVGILFVICYLSFVIFVTGCGTTSSSATTTTTTTTTTTSTTTTTVPRLYVNAAKGAGIIASGSSSIGQSATAIGSAAGNTPSSSSIDRFQALVISALSGPPDGFFTSVLGADGYISLTAEAVNGNMTPSMRMYTLNHQLINNEFMAGKKTAVLGTVEVRDIMSGSPGVPTPGLQAGIQSFITKFISAQTAGQNPYSSSEVFSQNLTHLAEYIAWCQMYPTMESMLGSYAGPPYSVHLTTPETSSGDRIGSMECKMAFSNNITGEIIVLIKCDVEGGGKPIAGNYSGTGLLSLPGGSTLDATAVMTFVPAPGNDISLEGIVITGTITPEGNTLYVHINPMLGNAGSGLLSTEAGTRIGTMEFTASGGYLYLDSGTREAFSY